MDDTVRAKLSAEINLHAADFAYGMPLQLGEMTIAYHAANCPRCAYLARKAALGGRDE